MATTLKEHREKRRAENKAKRENILKRAQGYEEAYQQCTKAQVDSRRKAKLSGQIYVPSAAKVAFVVRIRGINKLHPKIVRILRLLRLRQIHNGVFVRLNKASINMLRRVEPYITFGYS